MRNDANVMLQELDEAMDKINRIIKLTQAICNICECLEDEAKGLAPFERAFLLPDKYGIALGVEYECMHVRSESEMIKRICGEYIEKIKEKQAAITKGDLQ